MNKHIRNILYGFLVWLIPFVVSILFYTKEGGLTIDVFLFKTIMIVIGSIFAAFLLISYFGSTVNLMGTNLTRREKIV